MKTTLTAMLVVFCLGQYVFAGGKPSVSPADLQAHTDQFRNTLAAAKADGLIRSVKAAGETMTVVVDNRWHEEVYQNRLQAAQVLWQLWAKIHTPDHLDRSRLLITDGMGNKVGGSRALAGSLIWVKK